MRNTLFQLQQNSGLALTITNLALEGTQGFLLMIKLRMISFIDIIMVQGTMALRM